MSLNPYESPDEITDQPAQPWHPELRQILYALSAAVVAGLYLSLNYRRNFGLAPLPPFELSLFCVAVAGAIVGPIFFLVSLTRWLIAK